MPPAKRKTSKKRSTRSSGSRARKGWRRFIPTPRILLVASIWGISILLIMFAYFYHDLPDTDKLTAAYENYSIRIESADGQVITTLGGVYGRSLRFEQLPKHLIYAVLATEDRRFFEHNGFDVVGFARAMWVNLQSGRIVQGGSTITQQLAKVVFLSPERTIKRKIQELMLAFWLESNFTKEEIFTMYLNRVYFGSGYFGIDAAAEGYFNKPAELVTRGEAAMLAGLLKAPSRYSPFINPALAKERTTQVLANMVDAEFIAQKQAISEGIPNPKSRSKASSRFYFVDWIAGQIPDYVGIIDSDLTVVTTLDLRLQEIAERAVRNVVDEARKFRQVEQAALLTLSPRGEVVAMVGGYSYGESQFNRVTQAKRQPGSAFKFFVYLAALEYGFKPETMIRDEEISIKGWGPKNYDNIYRGPVSLVRGIAESINTVAVMVSEQVGRRNVISRAHQLGVQSYLADVPSIALGTSEITLLEMTQAMAHMPNEGFATRAFGIKEIRAPAGLVLYKREGSGGRVIRKDIVAQMNSLLKAVMTDGTGRRVQLKGRESAGKTGTTQDFRDAWFIGYTPQLVTGVWVGNDNNSAMNQVTGSSLAGEIWYRFMDASHKEAELKPLSIPTKTGWFDWLGNNWQDERPSEESQRRAFWDKITGAAENP